MNDTYSEKDLESAIIIEMQKFIIELGNDFAFLARQKRITIDNRDYKMDLLFYHRRLKCLIVIDLKLGDMKSLNYDSSDYCDFVINQENHLITKIKVQTTISENYKEF